MSQPGNESKPGGEQEPEPEFLAEFQKAISAFADATNAGNDEGAEKAAMAALMMAGMEAMKNPTPALRLGEEAEACQQAGDWAGAEAAYLKLLEVQEQSGNFGLITKPLMDLSRLYRYSGKLDLASRYARAATAAARKADFTTLLAMTLDNEAATALACQDVPAALAASAEAVRVLEPGRIFDSMRARALTSHAECLLAGGDTESAASPLQSAWELLKSRARSGVMPGPLVTLSHWWRVKAELCLKQGKPSEAADALTQAVQIRRELLQRAFGPAVYGHLELAALLERLAALSTQLGDAAQAQQALAEAKTIREQLKLPPPA